jgi:hypothetical protein
MQGAALVAGGPGQIATVDATVAFGDGGVLFHRLS